MFENKCILTGVKPTGKPHIGNYFGAILPAIKMANEAARFNLFIADYHAINFMKDAQMLQQEIKEIATKIKYITGDGVWLNTLSAIRYSGNQ